MQTANAGVWPKTILRVLAFIPLVLAAGLAQAPAASPTARQSASSYYDPLPQDTGAAGLKQTLRRLQNTGRLMMVTAHPDDEDGGLLTLESRGKGVRCLLMTLTRGEGGQNELGTGLSDRLGVLRTLELLAADRYYGVEQRFSRVADFGYSKTPEETFQKWGGHDVPLADIVRVIRAFRPDVLIARFSGTERDGHGHHQASSILAQEAFRAAGDPARFPEQIQEGLQPWQPKKLYAGNVCGFGASTCPDENWTVRLNTGEEDPALGTSFFQFALEGLRHQQSQGLGDLKIPPGPRYAFYKLKDSVLPKTTDAIGHEKDLFDGIETSLPSLAGRLDDEQGSLTWLRPQLEKIAGHIGDGVGDLAELSQELQWLRERIDATELSGPAKTVALNYVSEKQEQAEHALNLALGVTLEASVSPPQGPGASPPSEADALTSVSAGQRFTIVAKLHNGSKYWLNMEGASLDDAGKWLLRAHAERTTIGPGEDYYANFFVQVPADAAITRPHWHRGNPETDSVNDVDIAYANLPLPPAPLKVSVQYELGGHKGLHSPAPDFLKKKSSQPQGGRITAPVEVLFANNHGVGRRAPLAITPVFSVALEPAERVLPVGNGTSAPVKVAVAVNKAGAPPGKLSLLLPSGWRAEPESFRVELPRRGNKQEFEFKVFHANLSESRVTIQALLQAGGLSYREGYSLVTREDLGAFYYYEPAVQRVSIVDVKVPKDRKVAYVVGAGDDIPTVLQQIGMNVAVMTADKLATADLKQYGTVVLGVRAYDAQKAVAANNQKLLDFVSNGGTLIVQNNNSVGDFNNGHYTPYPAELSRARVSVEDAAVQILAPEDPVFRSPNQITQKDFDGWVQERGLYFMSKWDDHFKPLLSCHDPGEPDQQGGLLVAKYGNGTYIYTGYAFFRQLPAGVPGAIRLFVNLVSAGRNSF